MFNLFHRLSDWKERLTIKVRRGRNVMDGIRQFVFSEITTGIMDAPPVL